MKEPKIVFNKNVCQIKVTFLNGNKKQPHRVIEIIKFDNLTNLFVGIITSFDMYFGHLFGFYDNIKNWTKSKTYYEHFVDDKELEYFAGDDAKSTDNTTVQTMITQNPKMLLLYDYGTEKRFLIEFIKDVQLLPNTEYPRTVKQSGKVSKKYMD